MEDKGFKIIAIIALVFSVAGLTIAYAGFTSTLTIEGTATVTSAWNIKWDTLTASTPVGYASTTGATLAIDSTNQAISGTIGTLKAPGDSITYSWNATNAGDIDATLTGITKGSLSCAPATGSSATQAQATSLCSSLSVSFTYGGVALPASGLTGLETALNKSSSKAVTMTISYDAGDGVEIGGDVTVTLSTTSFTYSQKTS